MTVGCLYRCCGQGNSYNVGNEERAQTGQQQTSRPAIQQFEIEEEEESERGYWGSKIDFMLSSIGFAVGLGNVWRFPYLCYKNGGGAFLIPYIIMLALAGIPLFYLELAFGQFASLGCLTIWKSVPLFKGLGYAMVIVSVLVAIYYNVIIAYTIFYTFASVTSELPWIGCYHYWNTHDCYDGTLNTTNLTTKVWSSQEYYYRYVLDISDDIDNIGMIRWQLAMCLLAGWFVVYLCIIKGVKSSGKVVYFTAVFPYVVLTILLIRGVTLPGAGEGIKFYLNPRWELLMDATVWRDAASQIFYSLGIAFGALITFSSYNKFNNNACRDALIVALINCGTSVFAGFVIFSTLGFMAQDSGVDVSEVVDQGPGLAFIAYPEAISRLPGAPFWSFLFFFMLFTLGLDSQFAMMETIMTAIFDELPQRFMKKKPLITALTCFILFLAGLPCTTRGGVYVVTLMDWYSAGFSLLFIATLMCIAISLVYGIRKFSSDINSMMDGWLANFIGWKICWIGVSPILMTGVMIFSFIKYSPASYGDYIFPPWAEGVGWAMAMLSVVVIPLYMVLVILRGNGNILENFRESLKPTWDWGPALNRNRVIAGYETLPINRQPPGHQPSSSHKANPNVYQQPPDPSIHQQQQPDTVIYQPPPDTDIYQPPPNTGIYQPPPNTGIYQTPSDTNIYQAPPDTNVYQTSPNTYNRQMGSGTINRAYIEQDILGEPV
ncbi:sodium-dependent proline transporter-like [Glandiceps talaboti]